MRGSRGRILASAAEMFASRGYDATSVGDVCRAAMVTKPTVYYFYGSKEGLYRCALEHALAELARAIGPYLSSRVGTLTERARDAIMECFEAARRRPADVRLALGALGCHAAGPSRVGRDDLRAAILRTLAGELDAARDAGQLAHGSSECRSLVLLGAVMEALTGSLSRGSPQLDRRLADEIVSCTLGSWRESPPRRSEP